MTTEKYPNKYSIQTVDNALCVLEAISKENGPFGVSYLSSKLGMDKTYVFRMLANFEQRGFVEKLSDRGEYRLGLTAYATGIGFIGQQQLLHKSQPVMKWLAQETGEAVYLAIPGENDLLLFDMVESRQQIRVMPLVGHRYALDEISAGKVILAFTDETGTGCRYGHILVKGAALDQDAIDTGVSSLSVPVFDMDGADCASLSVIAPSYRFDPATIEQKLLSQARSAAANLSATLGFSAPQQLQAI